MSVPVEMLEILAERFRVLGDAARLRILHALKEGELSVTGLIATTGLGQANLSKHLQILHASGFVERRREGLFVLYRSADGCVVRMCDDMCAHVGEQAERQRRLVGAAAADGAGQTSSGKASRQAAAGRG